MGRRKKPVQLYDKRVEDMKGYVVIPRSAFTLLEKGELTPFEAACDLIYQTTCKPSKIHVGGEDVQLGENEKNITERFLERRWNWSRGWIRSFTEKLGELNIVKKRVEKRNGSAMSIFKKSPLELPEKRPATVPAIEPVNKPPIGIENQEVKNKKETRKETSKKTINSGVSIPANRPNTNISINTKESNVIVQEKPAPSKARKNFKKPTLEELQGYFIEKLNDLQELEHLRENIANDQSERFYDHYESKGWKVGKNGMKDWKASVRNWVKGFDLAKYRSSFEKEKGNNGLFADKEEYTPQRMRYYFDLVDKDRQAIIANIFKNKGSQRAFDVIKQYCLENGLDKANAA